MKILLENDDGRKEGSENAVREYIVDQINTKESRVIDSLIRHRRLLNRWRTRHFCVSNNENPPNNLVRYLSRPRPTLTPQLIGYHQLSSSEQM